MIQTVLFYDFYPSILLYGRYLTYKTSKCFPTVYSMNGFAAIISSRYYSLVSRPLYVLGPKQQNKHGLRDNAIATIPCFTELVYWVSLLG